MMRFGPIISVVAFASLLLFGMGCYYDNEEDLYPAQPVTLDCDTTDVSYAEFVQPLMVRECTGCHGGNFPSANIGLETYEEVVASANDNNSLYGSMAHIDGFSEMPKGGNRLPDCELDQLKAWIDAGTPNN
ncbi:MAG: hypothetical protein AAF399_08825 [Bacteroidota bacterium]